jgi:hypothetical protein
MIMNANLSQHELFGDTNARVQPRSRHLELYTRAIFDGPKKKSARSFCRRRRQTALWV